MNGISRVHIGFLESCKLSSYFLLFVVAELAVYYTVGYCAAISCWVPLFSYLVIYFSLVIIISVGAGMYSEE